jgi:DNA-binding NarL/FixJ family response regulator
MEKKVLVIESQTYISELLKQFTFDSETTFQCISASIKNQEISFFQDQQCDLIIFDTNIPDLNSIHFLDLIKSKHPDQKIMAVTSATQPLLIQKMIDKGINGIILRNVLWEIVDAVESILAGNTYWGKGVKKITTDKINNKKSNIELTRREVEILSLISEGLTNHKIAEKLFICSSTVDSHRKNLLLKLCANNTAKLIKIAVSQGFI